MSKLGQMFFTILAVLLLTFSQLRFSVAQQQTATDEEGTGELRPAPCWTTTMEFYDPQAFPYFGVEGYYFDANPFINKRWVQRDEMLMRSSRGSMLTDMSGRKIWSPTTILVNCFEISFFGGLYTQRFARVSQIYGSVTDKSVACTGGGTEPTGFQALWDTGYDPYGSEYSVTSDTDCSDPGSAPSSSGSDWSCRFEWIVIEISYDGGFTWEHFWEGDALVCE